MTKLQNSLSSKQEEKVSGGHGFTAQNNDKNFSVPYMPVVPYGGQCIQQDQVIRLIKSEQREASKTKPKINHS